MNNLIARDFDHNDIAAAYAEANRLRREALSYGLRRAVAALRGLFTFGGARTAH